MEDDLFTPNSTAAENAEDGQFNAAWSMLIVGMVPLFVSAYILILLTLIKQKRKELICFTALCVSTFVLGLGYIASGCRRLHVIGFGQYFISPAECTIKGVHNFLFDVGESTSATVMCLLTGDQLASTISFRWYLKFTSRIVEQLLCFIYIAACIVYLTVTIVSQYALQEQRLISAFCYQDESVPAVYFKLHFYYMLVTYYISLMACIIALVRRMGRKKPRSSVGRLRQMIREKKAVQQVSVIMFFRLVFQMIPMTLLNFLHNENLVDFVWLAHPLGLSLELILYSILDVEIGKSAKICYKSCCNFCPPIGANTNQATVQPIKSCNSEFL